MDKGRRQCELVAWLLQRMQALPEVVLCSPYRRATETAGELLAALDHNIQLKPEERLVPYARVAQAAAAVLAQPAQRVMAVGHEPLLSALAAHLCGDDSLVLDLRKGGLVEIEIYAEDPPRGALLGVIRPGHLRRLKELKAEG